jgi:hypothetical protein
MSTTAPIILGPSATGDDQTQLQAAINYAIANHTGGFQIPAGAYTIKSPLIVADNSGGVYHQVSMDISGARSAKNAPTFNTTTINCDCPQGFAIGIQFGKGCSIRDINFTGAYKLAASLTGLQVDTLPFAGWDDGICRTNVTSPNCCLCTDPFSPEGLYTGAAEMYPGFESWCLPGMDAQGSTQIDISGCSMENFVVGVMLTPGFQLNGELIKVKDCSINLCRSAYACTQAQAKMNTIEDCMFWGNIHTVIDADTYGAHRGDGVTLPLVNNLSLAGYIHQLVNCTTSAFPVSFNNVYAEELFKIGKCLAQAGIHFSNFQIDFQVSEANMPSPDYYYLGAATHWMDCMLRSYGRSDRLIFNSPNNYFDHGLMSAAPVCRNTTQYSDMKMNFPTTFNNVGNMYAGGRITGITDTLDAFLPVGDNIPISVNKADNTGHFTCANAAGLAAGDLLVCFHYYGDDAPTNASTEYPLGYITSIVGNTVNLRNVGKDIQDGEMIRQIEAAKLSHQ